MSEKSRCDGVNVAGYWKGYPCCNDAKHEHHGNKYCGIHLSIAIAQPGRMEKCAEQLAKRKSKEKDEG
jgi:hypothetical protein